MPSCSVDSCSFFLNSYHVSSGYLHCNKRVKYPISRRFFYHVLSCIVSHLVHATTAPPSLVDLRRISSTHGKRFQQTRTQKKSLAYSRIWNRPIFQNLRDTVAAIQIFRAAVILSPISRSYSVLFWRWFCFIFISHSEIDPNIFAVDGFNLFRLFLKSWGIF